MTSQKILYDVTDDSHCIMLTLEDCRLIFRLLATWDWWLPSDEGGGVGQSMTSLSLLSFWWGLRRWSLGAGTNNWSEVVVLATEAGFTLNVVAVVI